jgi:SH3-like domain-containing protein
MNIKLHGILFLCALISSQAVAQPLASGLQARVKGDRVNLRAAPEANAEVVSQVADGVVLPVRSITADWVEVVPPDATDTWVAGEFVVDGTVVVNRLNARAGAGINHAIVGAFQRGDKVERRGSFGEWVKVAPPADARVWVSRALVEVIDPNAPVLPPPAAPAASAVTEEEQFLAEEPAPIQVLGVRDEEPVTPPPSDLRLIPLDGQGKVVQREGILKRSPVLMFNAPGTHRLVRREGNTVVTTAYLRGNVQQLNSLLDQQLLIRGQEYWTEEVRQPLIVIQTIEKRTF